MLVRIQEQIVGPRGGMGIARSQKEAGPGIFTLFPLWSPVHVVECLLYHGIPALELTIIAAVTHRETFPVPNLIGLLWIRCLPHSSGMAQGWEWTKWSLVKEWVMGYLNLSREKSERKEMEST